MIAITIAKDVRKVSRFRLWLIGMLAKGPTLLITDPARVDFTSTPPAGAPGETLEPSPGGRHEIHIYINPPKEKKS